MHPHSHSAAVRAGTFRTSPSATRNRAPEEKKTSSGLVFGNSLQALPQCRLPDGSGTIPRFLMEACTFLSQHLETEGIFRKPGSAARMRNLKVKLQRGDCSLEFSSASDVAGLLKQFFRELPEPIVPAGFHGPLCQAQQLPAEDERSAVTLLLTCLMPMANVATMKYFLSFLQNVAGRSEKNKMGVHNLAVVFAPNLFQLFDTNGKLAGSVEKALPLLTQATEILIGQAQNIGHLPPSVLSKLPSLDTEAGFMTTGDPDGRKLSAKQRKRLRRSVGVIVSGALSRLKTSITLQPNRYTVSRRQGPSPAVGSSLTAKRKAADDSARIPGISPKKRRSLSDSEEAKPESCVDDGSPGSTDFTRADLGQVENLFPVASQSPSAFLKTWTERDVLSAGGRRAPFIASVTRMGNSKATSYRRQRIPLKKAAAPSTVDHQESGWGSPRCHGLSGREDSINTSSKVFYRDWMTPTLSADVAGFPLCGTRLLSTPVMQGNDPQECDLPGQSDQEPPRSPGLVSAGIELSTGEADTADRRAPSLKAKARALRPCSALRPSVADRPGAGRKDQSWTGCKDAVKTDFSPACDHVASLPCFLQRNSTLRREVVRRSLSFPEGISDNWEHGAGFGDSPDLLLEGTPPAARAENPPAFGCGPSPRPGPAMGARHRSADLAGLTTGPLLSQGPALPLVAQVESSATHSLYETGDGLWPAKGCEPAPCNAPGRGSGKSHPQPSTMALARASVAGCIRKFNKLSVKRDGLKQKSSH
ncbi:uncharacterized protein LOC134352665 isoform X2 [Mobula hypostoma]|uniref:uncharacterized protein LOC134352665 isoform X2 n=1 Tax=Mobula hypostoma TaxID=723540 RepID=UPI002FC3042B